MTVYIAPEVAAVIALHPYLRDPNFRSSSIHTQLDRQAETILAAFKRGDLSAAMHIMCWWPGARGQSAHAVYEGAFTLQDAKQTIAREFGFKGWDDVAALSERAPDPVFENALDHMLDGDLAAFARALDRHPNLATDRAPYGHRATLLHYIAANGVETHRQVMPLNAAELAHVLIARGADIGAHADMYGGGQTPLELAETSAHPHNAGVSADLNRVLMG